MVHIGKDLAIIFKDRSWLRKTLLGGVFLMLPVLNILSFGFLAKFIHSHLEEGEKKLPEWNDWLDLFFRGFEWGLIIIFYLIIPLLILSLMPESVPTFIVNPSFVINQLNPGGFLLLAFSGLIMAGVVFFLPMALILFADTGVFLNAFNINEILEHVHNNFNKYVISYILTIIILGLDFYLHTILSRVNFGILPSYFLFMWIGFIALLISGSLFIESF